MIFIDTGGWLSVAVTTDVFHQAGLSGYSTLLERSIRLFTSNFVLDETITRIRYDYSHTQSVQFCDLYQQAERKGFVTTLWVDPPVVDESLEIFRKYSDQRFSFTDCTSFVLMKRYSLTEAFTFDSHFETLGFIRKPPSRSQSSTEGQTPFLQAWHWFPIRDLKSPIGMAVFISAGQPAGGAQR